jgi:hypothetical protein
LSFMGGEGFNVAKNMWKWYQIYIFHFCFIAKFWLKFSFTCFTSSYGWLPLCFASSHGWSSLVLHLPMDDHHLFYIFPWMIVTCFTSCYG